MTGMKSVRSAVIYCRISEDRTGQGIGVQRQEKECRDLCKRLGWEVVEVCVDNDISASGGKHRPAYQRALEMLSNGEADAFVSWAMDRVTRRPAELESFVDVVERSKAAVQLCQVGDVDLTTPAGRMVARIVGATARFEVEQKQARQRAAERQRASAGKRHVSGKRPFGWAADRVSIEPVEAQAIRQAVADICDGKSLKQVIREWNANPLLVSAFSKPWNHATVRQVLSRPSNAGLAVYQNEVLHGVQVEWEPILTVEEFERLTAVLNAPGRRMGSSTNVRKHLLSGLATCGECGAKMKHVLSGTGSRTQHSYRCRSNAGHGARKASGIESLVTAAVLERLSQPDVIKTLTAKPSERSSADKALLQRIEGARSKIARAEADYAEDLITGTQLKAVTDEMTERIRSAQANLVARIPKTRLIPDKAAASQLTERWNSLPIDQKQEVIRTLMTVTVHRRTDPEFGMLPFGCRIEWV